MTRTQQPTINRAIVRTDEELVLVRTERAAFEAFLDRLDDVRTDSSNTPETGRNHTSLTTITASASTELRTVRQAYRETVMGVSHYDREYGDTLPESLAAELGETLACHVVTGRTLTPTIRESLVEATKRTRDDRDGFLDQLQQERRSLAAIRDELNEIEARVVELDDRIETTTTSSHLSRIDETLETLEDRCTDLVARRQKRIQNRGNQQLSGFDSVSLSQYLYRDLGTVTPAIADIVSCLGTVRYERTRCLR